MIKTAKQLSVIKNKLIELKSSRDEFMIENDDIESAKYKVGITALNGLIEELENDIKVYHDLLHRNVNYIRTKSIEDLPQVLIKARLAKKMTQKDLADILDIDVQQIQRYEATDYESASWVRIVEVIMALNINIKMEKIIVAKLNIDQQFHLPENITEQSMIDAEEKIRTTHLLNI